MICHDVFTIITQYLDNDVQLIQVNKDAQKACLWNRENKLLNVNINALWITENIINELSQKQLYDIALKYYSVTHPGEFKTLMEFSKIMTNKIKNIEISNFKYIYNEKGSYDTLNCYNRYGYEVSGNNHTHQLYQSNSDLHIDVLNEYIFDGEIDNLLLEHEFDKTDNFNKTDNTYLAIHTLKATLEHCDDDYYNGTELFWDDKLMIKLRDQTYNIGNYYVQICSHIYYGWCRIFLLYSHDHNL
jgi:hypothetical protein